PWCDPHHLTHWVDGGKTAPFNLVLLCRPHHTLVHEAGFGLRMVDGKPVFRRPDGSVIDDGRAPP
ncbi:MAG: HNH endonuclease signature motif containing protein, partial [Actinomycetota bacterium]